MKLIREIIERRLDIMKDLELNHDDLKSIWHFYQVYQVCINILGIEDRTIKKKNILIRKLLLDRNNPTLINKLKRYISHDSYIVESVLSSLKEKEEVQNIFEDFYPDDVFAVSIFDI